MFSARVVLDSVSDLCRITTVELVFPRFILAEVNTHRMLSKSSASSRAIPNATMVQRVLDAPFVPESWTGARAGMQGGEPISEAAAHLADATWRNAAIDAAADSRRLAEHLKVHKQYANRLLEPFLWHTAVVTATEWGNLFGLRVGPMAQPEFDRVMRLLQIEMVASKPTRLEPGQWHLPYVTGVEFPFDDVENLSDRRWAEVSAARCARVSYKLFDGTTDPEQDRGLFKKLVEPGHMSPLEHPARALSREEWEDIANHQARDWIVNRIPVGNFWGWLQLRKTVSQEHDFSLRGAK